ncbi:MAG: peptidase S10, partial [Acidobacteriaceae bacterium]|nr:peptidase S10 [Acidobacteriaceae bacterium]
MRFTKLACAALLGILSAAGLLAQQQQQRRNTPPTQGQQEVPPPSDGQQPRKGPVPEEKSSVTHHKAVIGGQSISYTATAANYVIKSDDGTPKASFFSVYYMKDDVPDVSKRPVSFVYNGGPGSGSLFTHMGLGPKRPALTEDGHGLPAPYSTEDNADSFLDATDLVFIDAVSTGFSRPAPGEAPQQFYGVVNDATYFSDFIYQFLTRSERWASPKFLIGESYGTTRSAELSYILQQRHQIYLAGVALVSSVAFANWGADDRSKFFLPTYAVSAWYHHLLPPDLQKLSIEQMAQQARQFAHGEYAAVLEKGDQLTPAEREKIVKDIARFTGLTAKYIEQTNLRISPQRWFKELERDKRRTVGR